MSARSSEKSREAAAHLKARGIYHGKRQTKPFANSGGTTMTWAPGSSRNQRRAVK